MKPGKEEDSCRENCRESSFFSAFQENFKKIKKNFTKAVDKGEMLWYSNIAVGESGALQELQKFLKKQIFKKMKKVLDKPEKM